MGMQEVLGVAGATIGFIVTGFNPMGAQVGFMIGSGVGALIDGPTEIDGPKIGDIPVQSSRDGVPIPIGWGLVHTRGNIIQTLPPQIIKVKEKQGKGDSKGTVTTSERVLRTFAIGVCRSMEGPIKGIKRIWENDKLVYGEYPFSNTSYINYDPDGSLGSDFAKALTIYRGTEDQLPDSELEAYTGVGNQPAYRGLAYVVVANYDVTDFGGSIPNYRFEVEAHGGEIYTTHVYPLEASDEVQIGCTCDEGFINPIPEDAAEISFDMVGMSLRQTRFTTNVGSDAAETSFDMIGMNLRQLLKDTDVGDDGADTAFDMIGMSMRQALIRQTMVPERMQIDVTLSDGSMTSV